MPPGLCGGLDVTALGILRSQLVTLPWQGFWSGGGRPGSLILEASLPFPQESVWTPDASGVGMLTFPLEQGCGWAHAAAEHGLSEQQPYAQTGEFSGPRAAASASPAAQRPCDFGPPTALDVSPQLCLQQSPCSSLRLLSLEGRGVLEP